MSGTRTKVRNRIAQALREDRRFQLKVHNPKKRPPKGPTVEEALIEFMEEEEIHEENNS